MNWRWMPVPDPILKERYLKKHYGDYHYKPKPGITYDVGFGRWSECIGRSAKIDNIVSNSWWMVEFFGKLAIIAIPIMLMISVW